MRRAILSAAVGVFCVGSALQAGEHHGRHATAYAYPQPTRNYVDGVTPNPYANPYGGYGRQLRGGFGINGFAPAFGPVWGPEAFIYANGQAMDPRPHGSYTRNPFAYGGMPGPRMAGGFAPGGEVDLPIKIVNPADSETPLTYAVNDFEYTINPGESQTLANDREWIISFDRGGDFGTARQTLMPGTHAFVATAAGWEVRHTTDAESIAPPLKPATKNPLPARRSAP